MKKIRLLADLDEKLIKEFKKKLIDDDLYFKDWLKKQIEEYLKQKGGKKAKSPRN